MIKNKYKNTLFIRVIHAIALVAPGETEYSSRYISKHLRNIEDDIKQAIIAGVGETGVYFPEELAWMVSEYTYDLNKTSDLFSSIAVRDFEGIKRAVQEGADVNFADNKYHTPLMFDIINAPDGTTGASAYDFAQYLIQNGADVNLTIRGHTALMYLVEKNIDNVINFVDLLINNRANVNAANENGYTVLMYAAYPYPLAQHATRRKAENIDNGELIQHLIKYGARVNDINKNGETALMMAAKAGNYKVAKTLINNGANANIKDNIGKTAFDYAQEIEIKNLLKPESEMKRELEVQSKEGKKQEEILQMQQFQQEDISRIELFKAMQRQRKQEEEILRNQRAQEALAQVATQAEEETWGEETQPECPEEAWGELEQED